MGEVTDMPAAFLYELIIAIVNCGHADTVMDAARAAGAAGGTVLHAKGTQPGRKQSVFRPVHRRGKGDAADFDRGRRPQPHHGGL